MIWRQQGEYDGMQNERKGIMRLTIEGDCLTEEQANELSSMLEEAGCALENVTVKAQPGTENFVRFEAGILDIVYKEKVYIFRSVGHLAASGGRPFAYRENLSFRSLGTMIDCSRNGVYTLTSLKKFIRYLALCGYNRLQLYTEDTYRIDGEPYFGYLRGAYTKSEWKELDIYAASYGIELVPCIQTLAHLEQIFRWKPYAEINDVNDILLVDDERTYRLIDKMFATVSECFSSRTVNIGMDEAFMLGLGQYHRLHGKTDRMELMLRHLHRVSEMAEKYGLRCAMWSDMFYRLAFGGYYDENAREFPFDCSSIPQNVSLIYWDYYSKSQEHYEKILEQHRHLSENIWFAGAFWTFLGFLPNNTFSIEAAKASVRACRNQGVSDVFFAMWGDFGAECSIFSVLPSVVYAAEFAYGNEDLPNAERRFFVLSGVTAEAFLALEQADKIGNPTGADLTDPSKYMLYNDCFAGVLDTMVTVADGREYGVLAERLKPYISHRIWGNLFRCVYALTRVMEYKVTIGIRTRALYRAGKKEELRDFAERDYKILIGRLQEFYSAFSELWHAEKKAYGFEITNYRLGGLISRVKYCQSRLADYCDGKIERIDELEEDLLDYFGEGEKYTKRLGYINEFQKIASVNKF